MCGVPMNRSPDMWNRLRIYAVVLCMAGLAPAVPCTAQVKAAAGLSLPVGDFAGADSATGGYANTGISVGIETQTKFYFGSELGFSVLVSYHPVDVDGVVATHRNILPGSHIENASWVLVWPMAGLGYSMPVAKSVRIFARGLGGVLFGASPDLTVRVGGTLFTQNMAFVVTAAYGGSAGFTVGRIGADVRFLYARPEYSINVQGGGTSTERRSLYVTSTVQLLVTYTL